MIGNKNRVGKYKENVTMEAIYIFCGFIVSIAIGCIITYFEIKDKYK